MGLKGAGPYFQRSMQTKVFHGLVYIDDVLSHGKTEPEFLTNTRRLYERLRATNVAVNAQQRQEELYSNNKLRGAPYNMLSNISVYLSNTICHI